MRLTEVVEAVLFVADSPLVPADIVAAVNHNAQHNGVAVEGYSAETPVDLPAVDTALSELMVKYAGGGFAFELKAIGGGYQFMTKGAYAPFIKAAALVKEHRKLSRAALETLAIIAYRQPVTRAEIEFIRGVNCEYALHRLLEKQLVEPAGRAELPGRPLLYRTSKAFMDYFGLAALADLPKLSELKADEEALAEAFRTRAQDQPEGDANESADGPQQGSLLEPPTEGPRSEASRQEGMGTEGFEPSAAAHEARDEFGRAPAASIEPAPVEVG